MTRFSIDFSDNVKNHVLKPEYQVRSTNFQVSENGLKATVRTLNVGVAKIKESEEKMIRL